MEERRPADSGQQARRRGGLDALSRGSLVHRVLELHDFGGGPDPSEQAVELAAGGLGLRPAPEELPGDRTDASPWPCASSRRDG